MQTFFLSLKKLDEILLRQIIFRFVFASIAQLAEHAPRKRKVASSILAGGYLNRYKGRWSRGMILRSGRRGRGFDSRTAPSLLVFYFLHPAFIFPAHDHTGKLPQCSPRQIRNVAE